MQTDAGTPPPQGLPPMPSALRSMGDFHDALRWSLDYAQRVRSRHLVWLDADFAVWPLDDGVLLQSLAAWLQLPQRRLTLVAHGFDELARRCPRFVRWRRDWTHAVEAWSPSEGVEVRLPTLVIDEQRLCLQLFDRIQWRGRLALDEAAVQQWKSECDALLQRCEATFSAYPLGL